MAKKEIEKEKISIIIPTYNEKENLPELVKEIFSVLKKEEYTPEIVVVDDNSPDGTGQIAEELSKKYPIKVIKRPEKQGLSSAVIDGIKATDNEIIGVMDSDLSHDPAIMPKILDAIVRQKNQLVIGSRYVKGGRIENWPIIRRIISWIAVLLAIPFTRVKDRTSGYFFFRREIIENVNINPSGFKIALDIIIKGNYKRWKEIPYTFKDRTRGKSKFTAKEVKNYISQLAGYIFYKKK